MKRCWPLFLLAYSCAAQSPSPQSAQEAYQYVQDRRGDAKALLYDRDDAGSIDKGIKVLDDALQYLDRGPIRDLALGHRYLDSQKVSLYFDLAEAYSLEGKDRESLERLRQILILAPDPKTAKSIEGSVPLKRMHDNPEFIGILRQFREFEHFWDSPALTTPFRQNIPDAEKLAGLAKFWSEVKYNFGFPEKLLAVNWDNLYLEWIPRVLATPSTRSYYRELQALCARLTDGHTAIIPPRQLDLWAKPPFETRLIEGHVMILRVMSPALEAQGVAPGMEITEVDGKPAVIYAIRELGPYESASTPQDLECRMFSSDFLRGQSNQPVRLKLRSPAGIETEKVIARSGYLDVSMRPGFEWRVLPGRIAYVAANRFDQQQVATQFGEEFLKICDSSAMILDLRNNGGGNSGIGVAILQYLLLEPVLGQRQVERSYNPTSRAREGVVIGTFEEPGFPIKPRWGERYLNPIVVLTSAATYSAAEDFLIAWQSSGRGKIIGEPSGGSTGMPVTITLPGGGSARICTKKDTFADGRVWEGIGIQPDILVRPTVADVIAGHDTVLERAIDYLKTASRPPQR